MNLPPWRRVPLVAGLAAVALLALSLHNTGGIPWDGTVGIALACVAVGAGADRLWGSAAAGIFAALLLGFDPSLFTAVQGGGLDAAALAALAVTVTICIPSARGRATLALPAACFAGGMAAGREPGLALLAIPLLCAGMVGRSFRSPRAAMAGTARVAAGVLCFTCGLFVACPVLASDPPAVWARLGETATRLAGAEASALGPARLDVLAPLALRARELADALCGPTGGWAPAVLAGFVGLVALRRWRHWSVVLLLPFAHIACALAGSVWHGGEHLAYLLPFQSLLAAGVVTRAMTFGLEGSRRARVARAAGIALSLLVGCGTVLAGVRRVSLVGWPDPAASAAEWLQLHAPTGTVVATESALPGLAAGPSAGPLVRTVGKLEKQGIGAFAGSGCTYLLRNASMAETGLVSPFNGRRFAQYQARYDEFARSSTPLGTWSPRSLNSRYRGVTDDSVLQLYALDRIPERVSLDVPLALPVRLDGGEPVVFPGTGLWGSTRVFVVGTDPATILVAGSGDPGAAVYAIAESGPFPVGVRIRGFGGRRVIVLAGHDADVVRLRRPAWRPAWSHYERLRMEARPLSASGEAEVCVRLLPTASAAALALADRGHLRQANELLEAYGERDAFSAAVRYRLAVHAGDRATADMTVEAAAALRQTLGVALRGPSGGVRAGGAMARLYDDFARCRTQERGALTLEPVEPTSGLRRIVSEDWYEARLRLPLRFPSGQCEVSLQLRARGAGSGADGAGAVPLRIVDADGRRLLAREAVVPGEPRWRDMAFTVESSRERDFEVSLTSPTPLRVEYRAVEMRWSMRDRLAPMYADLALAQAGHWLLAGDSQAALELLDGLAAGPARSTRVLARESMRFQCLAAGDRSRGRDIRAAAARVARLAPAHYGALCVMAGWTPRLEGEVSRLAGNLVEPIRFGQRVALVGWRQEDAVFELVFEAIAPEDAALRAVLWDRRAGLSQREGSARIGGGRTMQPGERVSVRITASRERRASGMAADLVLGLEFDGAPGVVAERPDGMAGDGVSVEAIVELCVPDARTDEGS